MPSGRLTNGEDKGYVLVMGIHNSSDPGTFAPELANHVSEEVYSVLGLL